MNNQILQALQGGFTPKTILNTIKKRYPQHADKITAAQSASYAANSILDHLAKSEEQAPTWHQQGKQASRENRKKNTYNLINTILVAGAGAAAVAGRGAQAASGAIRPSQITGQPGYTPRRPRPGAPTLNQPRAQLPAPQQALQGPPRGRQPSPSQGPINMPPPQRTQIEHTPQAPAKGRGRQPSPSQGTITPSYEHDPQYNIGLVQNTGLDKKLAPLFKSGLHLPAIEQLIREKVPKGQLAILEKAEGGLTQLIEDYAGVVQKQKSNTNRVGALQKFNDKLKNSMLQQETDRFQDEYGIQPKQEQQLAEIPDEEDMFPEEQIEEKQIEQQPQAIDQKVQQAAFSGEKPPNLSDPKLRAKSFALPTYQYKGESPEDFQTRKMINTALEKTAKSLAKGETFLDYFENLKDVQWSTASDVLRLMAGEPNPYDPFLDNEERQELYDGIRESSMQEDTEKLMEGGKLEHGTRPSPVNDPDVYGAQMTPNLVWNMLLAQEPKLAKLKKPTFDNRKMNTTKFRRALTHTVYGIISGKSISNSLADKIKKISDATHGMDTLVEATKQGNLRGMEKEMERMMDDDYFMSLFEEEIEHPDFVDPAIIKPTGVSEEEDTKMSASIKAQATRERKKATNGS